MSRICFITFHSDRPPFSIACHNGTFEIAPPLEKRAIIRYAKDQGLLPLPLAFAWLRSTVRNAVNQP